MADSSDIDICLLLEGTYPFIRGGVSEWIHQMLHELTDFKFHIVFLGSTKAQTPKPFYTLPSNVVGMTTHYLFDPIPEEDQVPASSSRKARAHFYKTLQRFFLTTDEREQEADFWHLVDLLNTELKGITFGNLCQDHSSWNLLVHLYEKFAPSLPFLDFFWTTRFLHLPVWQILRLYPTIPQARAYHTISTGYAGFLGSLMTHRTGRPCLLTEHGIYTKERIVEISQAQWIFEPEQRYFNYTTDTRFFKELWIKKFMWLGKLTYHSMSQIVTLYEGNRNLQIQFGAAPEKTSVIPNGIRAENYEEVVKKRRANLEANAIQNHVGFVGRIVSIKDVETLIQAAYEVVKARPQTKFLLYGPTEEEPEYFHKCSHLIESLHLQEHALFMGSKPVKEILPNLSIMVLTSISEGLPLVILEAFAAEIPVVSTQVGACRELILGRDEEDQAIGSAGLLTRGSSPDETAQAILTLLENQDKTRQMGQNGRKRVEQFYSMKMMVEQYHSLYKTAIQ